MDPADHYADPLGEALSYSSQRAAQLTSLAVAAAQIAAHRKTLSAARAAARDEQKRRALGHEEQAMLSQARAAWAPAHDPRWLAQADLLEAVHAWGAAASCADADPVAASAMRKSEDRMRTVHPYAMNLYDRLRADGANPIDAMRQAAPLFARPPYARPGESRIRLHLRASEAGPDADPNAGLANHSGPTPAQGPDRDNKAEDRVQQIVTSMQARARVDRGTEMNAEELITALETRTSLSAEDIARLARARRNEEVETGADRARTSEFDEAKRAIEVPGGSDGAAALTTALRDNRVNTAARGMGIANPSAAKLAAESFPCTAADGIRAATAGSLARAPRRPAQAITPENARQPRL